MRIISIEVENIKRLSAVSITPDGRPLVVISGKNAAGKSSVIDAIAMALGGKALCPAEPIRRGETSGVVAVNLGAYLVTRRFTRGAATGTISSSLTVTNAEGAKFPSPQALLDRLVSDLSFDPLGFLALAPRDQREQVRRIVGLDFADLDEARTAAVARQSEARRLVDVSSRDAHEAEHYPDAPAEPVNVSALLEQLADAERQGAAADKADQVLAEARRNLERVDESIAAQTAAVTEAEAALRAAQERLAACQHALKSAAARRAGVIEDGKQARRAADAARKAVPNTAAIRERLARANEVNAQVTANARRAALAGAVDEARAQLETAQRAVKAIDQQKAERLTAAVFPVPGLGFGEDGLTFDGLPFAQASTAQQLRVAVAMGLAQNPELRVLLVKHGNDLDRDSLRLLGELAEGAGAQVWLERVAESPDGVGIFIEDGAVKAVSEVA